MHLSLFFNFTNQLEIVRVLLHCFVFDKVVYSHHILLILIHETVQAVQSIIRCEI